MALGKSFYLANRVLDFNIGGVPYTPPDTLYIALFNSPIVTGGVGGTEVSAVGYARKAVANTVDEWGSASSGAKSNLNQIIFTPSDADHPWGTVVAVAIMDALTGGNILYYGSLNGAAPVNASTSVQFNPGDLVITEA